MTIRRVSLVLLVLALLANIASAQDDPVAQTRIAKAKKALVSDLEPGLPTVGLEQYLKTEVANAAIEWEVNDCGEQTGDPATTPDDFPMCAQATVSGPGGNKVIVMVAVGTFKQGIKGKPRVFYLAAVKPDGTTEHFSELSEIANQLNGKSPSAPQGKAGSMKEKQQ